MGRVTILPETTKKPITVMGHRAGICWGANVSNDESNYKRGLSCIKSGHGRVMEYADVHAVLVGYSAKCLREWYTHIGGAPSRLQASTRYIDYSKGDGFEYVTPETVKENEEALREWNDYMHETNKLIRKFIEEYRIPIEDSTNMLPLAYCSKMVDKRNARNIIDMSRNRMCGRAYWEFRNELLKDYLTALMEYSEEWETLIKLQMKPKCEVLGYCPEEHSCDKKNMLTL